MEPVGEPIIHASGIRQTTGEALYTDDIPKRPNEAVAVMLVSEVPSGKILDIGIHFLLKMNEIFIY